jgi:hypothetical protein
MSERLWQRADEWVGLASCGSDPRFVIAPHTEVNEDAVHLADVDIAAVQKICQRCPVRPECITASCVDRLENSAWAAGEWLTDTYTASNRRALERTRLGLIASLPHEYATRPDEAL